MMKLPLNLFKQDVGNQKQLLGLWLSLANGYCAEIASGAEFDWVLIDGEHAPNDIRTILDQLQAIAPYNTHAVVRPVEGGVAIIKQLLDIGAQNLLIPMVETAEQATTLVAATRYAPAGIRGVGAALGRASRWSAYGNYQAEADAQVCLLLQVESQLGLDNLDDILAVDGYDGVFIGTADLAASMGYSGEPGHADVQRAMREAIQKITDSGKAAGALTTEYEMAQKYRDYGASFIAVGIDVLLLVNALKNLREQYRQW